MNFKGFMLFFLFVMMIFMITRGPWARFANLHSNIYPFIGLNTVILKINYCNFS